MKKYLINQNKVMKEKIQKQKTNSKIVGIKPAISLIIYNVNGLNNLIKRQNDRLNLKICLLPKDTRPKKIDVKYNAQES